MYRNSADSLHTQREGGGDENTGSERRAPPTYGELSSHLDALEEAAEDSGNGDAAFYLTKGKMAMIAAHSAYNWVRQADEKCYRDVVRVGGTRLSDFLAVRFLSCLSWFVCFCFILATFRRVLQADTGEFVPP